MEFDGHFKETSEKHTRVREQWTERRASKLLAVYFSDRILYIIFSQCTTPSCRYWNRKWSLVQMLIKQLKWTNFMWVELKRKFKSRYPSSSRIAKVDKIFIGKMHVSCTSCGFVSKLSLKPSAKRSQCARKVNRNSQKEDSGTSRRCCEGSAEVGNISFRMLNLDCFESRFEFLVVDFGCENKESFDFGWKTSFSISTRMSAPSATNYNSFDLNNN